MSKEEQHEESKLPHPSSTNMLPLNHRMFDQVILKSEDSSLRDSRTNRDYARSVIRSWPSKRFNHGVREFQSTGRGGKKPI